MLSTIVPLGGSVHPMRSRRPWCFSHPTTAATSRERNCSWMAVSRKCRPLIAQGHAIGLVLRLSPSHRSRASRRLLLLDEPFEGLSPALGERLAGTIRELQRQGLSALIAESDSRRLSLADAMEATGGDPLLVARMKDARRQRDEEVLPEPILPTLIRTRRGSRRGPSRVSPASRRVDLSSGVVANVGQMSGRLRDGYSTGEGQRTVCGAPGGTR
jgi:hypothetical protein